MGTMSELDLLKQNLASAKELREDARAYYNETGFDAAFENWQLCNADVQDCQNEIVNHLLSFCTETFHT